jgi:hypothetical protein
VIKVLESWSSWAPNREDFATEIEYEVAVNQWNQVIKEGKTVNKHDSLLNQIKDCEARRQLAKKKINTLKN